MKKVFFAIAFVACMAFAACNNSAAVEPTDSISEDTVVVDTMADTVAADTLVIE